MNAESSKRLFRDLFSDPAEIRRDETLEAEFTALRRMGYHIRSLLGKGGSGRVYKAWASKYERFVAIKLLNRRSWLTQEAISRFNREWSVASRLRHPSIVRLLDRGTAAGAPFLVMELAAGNSLGRLVESPRAITLRQAMKILMQAAEGLDYAWRYGVVHRDLKPQNILITADGNAKIADFGSCKNLNSTSELTGSALGICTPQYAAPELMADKPVDTRSDVFSLGVIAYQMLTSELPFPCSTPIALHKSYTSGKRTPPRKLNRRIPPPLNDLILSMLEPSLTGRPMPKAVMRSVRQMLVGSGGREKGRLAMIDLYNS